MLVEEHLGKTLGAAADLSSLPGGAGLVSAEGSAWVLIDDGTIGRFGGALAWAWRHGVASLEVLVEGPLAAGVIARRAGEFAYPRLRVWAIDGRRLVSALPAPGVATAEEPDRDVAALLGAHGAEPVMEHGVLRGEVLGLEVARVVGDRLEVGVGRHDRHARAEMRPGEDVGSALDEAVGAVLELRRPSAPRHPANTLARSRWLRSVVIGSPRLVGAASLCPVAPPLPWFDLPEAGAAPAVGRLESGEPVVAVFSVGVDVDLVPTAADSRLLYDPSAALLLVVPSGDDVAVSRSLAQWLRAPAEVRTMPKGWEALGRAAPSGST